MYEVGLHEYTCNLLRGNYGYVYDHLYLSYSICYMLRHRLP